MIESVIREGGEVRFPSFLGERHHMVPFMQREGLPPELNHWQETVDDMLQGITSHEPIYFMVDQSIVDAGSTHRRAGVHVDGYWCPDILAHGGGGHSGSGVHGGHRGIGRHRGTGRHSGHMSGAGRWDVPGNWSHIDFSSPEALLLASDVQGARAWTGAYNESLLGEGGEASKVPVELLAPLDLKANRVYVGNVATLHASMPLDTIACRTVVRLNCPGVGV